MDTLLINNSVNDKIMVNSPLNNDPSTNNPQEPQIANNPENPPEELNNIKLDNEFNLRLNRENESTFDNPFAIKDTVELISTIKDGILNIFVKDKKEEELKLSDYDDKYGRNETLEKLKNDITSQLNVPAEHVLIRYIDGHLKLFVKGKEKPYRLKFEEKKDEERIVKFVLSCKSSNLNNLNETVKTVVIPNYDDNNIYEKDIQLFKDDVSRELGDIPENIKIYFLDNEFIAYVVGNENKKVLITFKDKSDFYRLAKLARQSKSPWLIHFGQKKQETYLEFGVNTGIPGPKNKTVFSQKIDYYTFLGENGKHKLKVGIEGGADIITNPELKDLKEIRIGYENSDIGDIQIKLKEGDKVSVNGTYKPLNQWFDNKFKKDLLNADPKAIAMVAGAIAIAGASIAIATYTLKEEKEIPIPLEARIYKNGIFDVQAGIKTGVTVGNKEFKIDLKEVKTEIKENIASGFTAEQKIKYKLEEKQLEGLLKLNYNNTRFEISGLYDEKNNENSKLHAKITQTKNLAKHLEGSISYEQDITYKGETKNPTVAIGLTYVPFESLKICVGANVTAPKYGEKESYGFSTTIGYRF